MTELLKLKSDHIPSLLKTLGLYPSFFQNKSQDLDNGLQAFHDLIFW